MPPFSEETFSEALQKLNHRGPDSEGIWASPNVMLGHKRLSIIDLSSAGHQPMHSFNNSSVIVFNGEIYNYLELKSLLVNEGIHIAGSSDSRVLLEGLSHWGLEALKRLNGMWAFALWCPHTRQLLLCRDRFGVKPLYYRVGPDGLAFASEPKALLKLFPEHRVISEKVLLDFLVNNQLQVPGESFYQGIYLLPAAHYVRFYADTGKLVIERYWDYPARLNYSLSPDDAAEHFGALLEDSVSIRLRSDLPVGLTLSGGLDSTAILTAAYKKSGRVLDCFTSVYGNSHSSEFSWAELACKPYSARLEPVTANQADWLSSLRDISWHMDGPGYSPAVYPLWCLMERSRQMGIPVILEGQGADEALAGYPQYAALELLEWISKNSTQMRGFDGFLSRARGLKNSVTAKWAIVWILRTLFPSLLRLHRKRNGFLLLLRKDLRRSCYTEQRFPRGSADAVNACLKQDHSRNILPGLLHYGDAISMAHSVETRNPFLDYRMVEYLFSLPSHFKIRDGQAKWILRQYLRRNGQQTIGNRLDKKGYPTPIDEWMRSENNAFLEEILLRQESPIHQWCDPNSIRLLIDKHKSGALASGHHLYKLLSTQIWIDTCINNL